VKFVEAGLHAYNRALTQTFYIGVGLAAVTVFGVLGMEWRKVEERERAG